MAMSNAYRSRGSSPLFALQRPFLRAIDPMTGQLLWEHEFDDPKGVGRIFLQEGRVLVSMGPTLHCFDGETGRESGRVELGFTPDSGVAHEGRLFLANRSSLACLASDGRIHWRAVASSEWDSSNWSNDTECRDATGAVLWKRPSPETDARAAAGLAIDGVVVQPDKGKATF
jgi:outer membrane protein assembly factor BamB